MLVDLSSRIRSRASRLWNLNRISVGVLLVLESFVELFSAACIQSNTVGQP